MWARSCARTCVRSRKIHDGSGLSFEHDRQPTPTDGMNDHSSGCTAAASGSSQVNARPFRWSSRSAPPHSLDHDQPFSLAGRSACMGRFLSRGFPRGAYPIILTSCFLVRPVSPFPRPDPHDRVEPARAEAVKDGRVSAHRRLVLEGFEHDGTLAVVGMTKSEGSCGLVHEASCHILVCGGPKTQTMMQGYASAASSEAADPFLPTALKPC